MKLSQIIDDLLGLCQEKLKYLTIDLIISSYTDVNLTCKASAFAQELLLVKDNLGSKNKILPS